ncbi:MAG: hypothetical protein DRQ89_12740 [Epsilonproteobacteria bacterium]|nr:MAG: hypothetical protein DRQ89_12740 [Campylobacterota bacterium]
MNNIIIGGRLKFDYTNWKGKKATREIIVECVEYGFTEFHEQSQWLLRGFCLEKNETRSFAMRDITNIRNIR